MEAEKISGFAVESMKNWDHTGLFIALKSEACTVVFLHRPSIEYVTSLIQGLLDRGAKPIGFIRWREKRDACFSFTLLDQSPQGKKTSTAFLNDFLDILGYRGGVNLGYTRECEDLKKWK